MQSAVPNVSDVAGEQRPGLAPVAPSYMTRVMRLTLLAPDIVEAVLDGTKGPDATLGQVLEPFPVEWNEQRQSLS